MVFLPLVCLVIGLLSLEVGQVKSVDDCVEMATLDCYGEHEEAGEWLTCFEEVLGGVKAVTILGEVVKLKGLDLDGNTVVAVCESDENRIKVTLDSIQIPNLTKTQKLWLKAWQKWRSENA